MITAGFYNEKLIDTVIGNNYTEKVVKIDKQTYNLRYIDMELLKDIYPIHTMTFIEENEFDELIKKISDKNCATT